jgi:hypothetical protein
MTAPSPAFSVLYDVRALTVVHALFAAWAVCVGVWLVRRRVRVQLLLDLAAITAISAVPRLVFFQKTSFRPGHLFRELTLSGDSVSYYYSVGVPALFNFVRILTGNIADPHDISWYTSLVIGILTPAVFYLLALRLTTDRKLAWTLALLLALNPAHVMFSGPHDFFIAGVFFEVVSHLLLLVFFQTRHFVFFAGFLLASHLFYQCRAENNAIFYLHALCVLYALWRLPVNKALMALGTVAFLTVNLAFQYDWYQSGTSSIHVIQHMWRAPFAWLQKAADPTWNHLVDWRWCPPYLPLLLVIGTFRMLKERSFLHVYPFVVFAVFLAVYSDLRSQTVHGNARYFLNITPAIFLVAGEALAWLYQRSERAFPLVVAGIVLTFAAYVPRLADNQYIAQYEWRFYWTQVRPAMSAGYRVWMYDPHENHWPAYERAQTASVRIGADVLARVFGVRDSPDADRDPDITLPFGPDFHQGWLFDDGRATVTHSSAALESGDYVFLGALCYQFVVAGDRMLPECERQLRDPRNEIVTQAGYPARFFHPGAPWVTSGAYRNFRTTTFYLLRRRA